MRHQLIDLASNAGQHFLDKETVWDLLFLDRRHLVAAHNNSTIEFWDVETGKARMIWLPTPGECVQLFHNTANKTLLVNCWGHESPSETFTAFFSIDLSSFAVTEIIRCRHSLSRNAGNYFLARQTDTYNKTLEDFILDPDYNIVYINRLGHFDLFNHAIRIDNAVSLYFLAGNPSEQNQNKILYRIDPPVGKINEVWAIERQPDHFNDINALLYGETVILSGRRCHASIDQYELFAYDPSLCKVIWHIILPGKVTAMVAMEVEAVIIVALTNGRILFFDGCNGYKVKTIIPDANLSFQRPASLAVYRDTLAVGLMNGEIRIYEC